MSLYRQYEIRVFHQEGFFHSSLIQFGGNNLHLIKIEAFGKHEISEIMRNCVFEKISLGNVHYLILFHENYNTHLENLDRRTLV